MERIGEIETNKQQFNDFTSEFRFEVMQSRNCVQINNKQLTNMNEIVLNTYL